MKSKVLVDKNKKNQEIQFSQPTLSISMRSDVDIINGYNQVDDGSKTK
jgi:hypothetical protein